MLLDAAAQHAARLGRRAATPADVLESLAIHGFYENMPKAKRLVARTCAYAWELASLARGRLRRTAPPAESTLTAETMALVAAASDVAASARHRVLTVEHLLVAALAAPGVLPTIARWLSHWDGTHPEVVKEMIGDTQDHYHRLHLPRSSNWHPTSSTPSTMRSPWTRPNRATALRSGSNAGSSADRRWTAISPIPSRGGCVRSRVILGRRQVQSVPSSTIRSQVQPRPPTKRRPGRDMPCDMKPWMTVRSAGTMEAATDDKVAGRGHGQRRHLHSGGRCHTLESLFQHASARISEVAQGLLLGWGEPDSPPHRNS